MNRLTLREIPYLDESERQRGGETQGVSATQCSRQDRESEHAVLDKIRGAHGARERASPQLGLVPLDLCKQTLNSKSHSKGTIYII